MATIAGPRHTRPPHVGTLAAVTPNRLYKPLKRSPRRQTEEGSAKPFRSLRDSYLAASLSAEEVLHAISKSSQLVAALDLDKSKATDALMAPLFNYKRLSSGPSSPATIDDVRAVNASTSAEGGTLSAVQCAIGPSPVSLLKRCTLSNVHAYMCRPHI
jgi:hypothetical protein